MVWCEQCGERAKHIHRLMSEIDKVVMWFELGHRPGGFRRTRFVCYFIVVANDREVVDHARRGVGGLSVVLSLQ